VKDIPCPKGLSYAPENASCIAFTIIMKPSDELAQYEEVRSCLKIGIIRAIDDGRLYNIVEDISRKDTKITGLGLPGDGVDYLGYEKDGTSDVDVQEGNEETAPTGLGGGYIFLIILALFALPVVLFVAVRYRERNEEEMERVREFAGKPADDTDDLDLENPAAPATAVPAAAAVAPVVAAPLVYPKGKRKRMNLLLMTTMTFLHPQFGQKVVVHKQIALLTRMQPPPVPCWDRPSQLWALHHLWQPTCMKRRLLVKRK